MKFEYLEESNFKNKVDLNKLGKQGWELIFIVYVPNTFKSWTDFYFKRRLK